MWLYILAIGLIIFLAHLFSTLFQKTKIPDVLLLMLIGIFVGPVMQWVTPNDFGKFGAVLTTIALITILFEGGTTLDMKAMRKALGPTLIISLLTFIATVAICFAFSLLVLRLEASSALITGLILGGTSSAVVVPMIRSLLVKEPVYTVLILESALTDVLCIVFTFVALQAVTEAESVAAGEVIWTIFRTLIFAAIIGVTGAVGWMLLLRWVRAYPNTLFTTLAFIFILYGIAEMAGLSGAITALAFGITLSNLPEIRKKDENRSLIFHKINEQEKAFFSEMVFILKTFFFLYLGISLKFDSPLFYLAAMVFTAMVFLARIPITRISFYRTRDRASVMVASVMVPKGLAAAVLATLPAAYGVTGAESIRDFVFAVVLVSILFTALLIPVLHRIPPYKKVFAAYNSGQAEVTQNLQTQGNTDSDEAASAPRAGDETKEEL
jgi:potassium/hydrogen antiporter